MLGIRHPGWPGGDPGVPEDPRAIMQDLTRPDQNPALTGDYDETIFVDSRTIGCDGGGGALGHPLIYLPLGVDDDAVCPYCSRHFVFTGADGATDGH
jgi:uncharacterized Zn-finger protein